MSVSQAARPVGCVMVFLAVIKLDVVAAAGPAGVKLDGTLGGSAAALSGPTFNISQGLGKMAGNNLSFSFQYFDIGTGHEPASSIEVDYLHSFSMDSSTISTTSTDANGGAIQIFGAGPLWLVGSNVTTSVDGRTQGNGGDIAIGVPSIGLPVPAGAPLSADADETGNASDSKSSTVISGYSSDLFPVAANTCR